MGRSRRANGNDVKERGLRLSGELVYVRRSRVGYTACPMPGANGPVFHINLEMNS